MRAVDGFTTLLHAQLLEDVRRVALHRGLRDEQYLPDFLVRQILIQQAQLYWLLAIVRAQKQESPISRADFDSVYENSRMRIEQVASTGLFH